MTDDDWDHHRDRAIMAALQTGRAVLADTDGELHYADGDRESLAEAPTIMITVRAARWSRRALVWSIVAAIANTGMGVAYWRLWQLALACVCLFSAIGWHRVNRTQRARLLTWLTSMRAFHANRQG